MPATSFAAIIRLAGANDQRHVRDEHIVLMMDLEQQQVTEDRFWKISSRYRRYVVANSGDPDAVVEDTEITAPLSDYEGEDGPLHLRIAYQGRCAPGDEARVAVALAGDRDPRVVVRDKILFWVDEHVADRQAFIDGYAAHAEGLRREIKERARRELGLTLKVKLSLVGGGELKPIEIAPKDLHVRVRGHRDRLKLRLEATLTVPARLLGKAIQGLARIDAVEGAIVAEVLRFFEAEVTLHQFHYGLGGPVDAELRDRLEGIVAGFGREIGRLHVESASPAPSVPLQYESTVEIERDLPGYPEKVKVKTHFWMILRDVGAYVERGSPPLAAWAAEAVGEATREVLFATRYSELVRHVDAKKSEIKRRTEEKARALGFDIEQFVAITNLPFDELREPFAIVAAERFSTRVPNVLAGLEVHTTARITDTARIEDLLDRRVNVREIMRQAVCELVAGVLHGVDPEEFYLYFDTPWPARAGDNHPGEGSPEAILVEDGAARPDAERAGYWDQTLQRRLLREIAELLARRFGAEVSRVVFKKTDTEITNLLDELRRRSSQFEVEVTPKGGRHLPVTFKLVLAVVAVDPRGWENFLTKRPSSQTVVETVQTALQGRLAEVDPEELRVLRSDELMRHINRWAADRIGTEFGLVVRVTDLSRGLIEDEKVLLWKVQLVLREEWEADQAEIRGETAIRAKQRAQESASLDSAAQDLEEHRGAPTQHRARRGRARGAGHARRGAPRAGEGRQPGRAGTRRL
ncbi:MAG: hypothetical protein QM820_63600 [Minicystis sp.]